jgi:hypothetical protein
MYVSKSLFVTLGRRSRTGSRWANVRRRCQVRNPNAQNTPTTLCTRRDIKLRGLKPNDAIDAIASRVSKEEIATYCMAATQVAVLGAAPLSNAWKNSGLNSWTRFARRVLRQEAHECLPPTIDGLVAWATAFKSRGTFDNYCGGLKSTCMMWRLDVSAFKEEILWRAKVAISKRALKDPGSPGITLALLAPLVQVALNERDAAMAALYVMSYWFLLRVPSEGLPACLGEVGVNNRQRVGKQLELEQDKATWHFSRRKNREFPTKAVRPHMCDNGAQLCPVCTLESFVDIEEPKVGDQLFPGVSAKQFNSELRRRMAICGSAQAETFTSKGFRRGQAQDLGRKYGVSPELKAAGDWTTISGALCYASREELEDLFVTKARKRKRRKRQTSADSSSSSSSE